MGLRLLSFLCDYIDLVQIGGGGKGEQVNTVFLALREWLLLLTGSGISDEIVCVCERERERDCAEWMLWFFAELRT